MNQQTAIFLMVLAVLCGGCMALFSKNLNSIGLTSLQITFIRSLFTAVLLFVMLLVMKVPLKLGKKQIWLMIGFGIAKFLSDALIFASYKYISVALATVLQMTQVFFIFIISIFLFKEKTNANKIVAIGMGVFGCLLISGVLTDPEKISVVGCLLALGSGAAFAIFTIGCKVNFDMGLHPLTGLFYIMLISCIVCTPFVADSFVTIGEAFLDTDGLAHIFGLVVISTLFPYAVMFFVVKYISVVYVSIIGLLELVAASLVGLLAFGEALAVKDLVGMAIVMSVIIIMDVTITHRIIEYCKKTGQDMPHRVRNFIH